MRQSLIAILFLLLASVAASAQPTVHNTLNEFTTTASNDVTSFTISNVLTEGTNRGLAVCVYEASVNTGITISTVVFNGSESLSFVAEIIKDSQREVEFWYLVDPTATTGDVVITMSGSPGISSTFLAQAIVVSDVAQSQPTLSGSAECNSCTTETADVTTTATDTLLLTCSGHNIPTVTWSHGSGQTEISEFGESDGVGEAMSTSYEVRATTGVETLESTANLTGNISLVAIGVEAFVSPPVAGTRRRVNSQFR